MGSDTYSKKRISELSLTILGHKIWTNFHIALMLRQLLSDRRLNWAIVEHSDSFSYIWRPEVLGESTMSKEKQFVFLKKLDTVEIPVPRNSTGCLPLQQGSSRIWWSSSQTSWWSEVVSFVQDILLDVGRVMGMIWDGLWVQLVSCWKGQP